MQTEQVLCRRSAGPHIQSVRRAWADSLSWHHPSVTTLRGALWRRASPLCTGACASSFTALRQRARRNSLRSGASRLAQWS